MPDREQLWSAFCERHKFGESPIALFDTHGNVVKTKQVGRPSPREILKRSPAMEHVVLAQVQLVLDDYASQTALYDGLIYCMYEIEARRPAPLYIGKTEKFGRSGGNLSANIKGIKATSTHPFARWGYNYAYHMGDLSSVVLGHPKGGGAKYERWAAELFEQPFSDRRLKRPIYFWCKAWSPTDVGPWVEYGPTSLTFLEYQLIGVASAAFPRLLNDEGVNRS